jgi:hypothetical protein
MAQNRVRNVPTFRAPSAYEEEMLRAQRQQQLAEMLRQQAFEPEAEPYTFQGFRATPTPANAIARVLSAYTSKKLGEKAEQSEAKARQADVEAFEALRRDLGPQTRSVTGGALPETDVTGIASAYQPEMAQQPMMETVMPTYQQREETLSRALASGTPMAQRYAQLMLSRQPQVSLEAIMEASPESRQKYQETGDPFALAKPPKAPNLPNKYEEFLIASQNPAFAKFLTDTTGNKTIVLPGERTTNVLADEFAKGIAAQDLETIKAGEAALGQIEVANNVRDLLVKNPITGFGANARLGLEQALSSAGFIAGDRASVTENLSANLAKTTLSLVKTSGLGSGQGFTDNDRKFLEKAAAGQIEMTNENLRYLADLNDKAARANIVRSNAVRSRYRELPNFRNMPGMLPDIVAPAVYGSQLPPGATLDRR